MAVHTDPPERARPGPAGATERYDSLGAGASAASEMRGAAAANAANAAVGPVEVANSEADLTPARWSPGNELGHFRILRRLGAGGMGVVLLAEQLEPINRQVALKLVQPRLLDAVSRAMFVVERQALAQLEHPNVARVYEAGEAEFGELYYAMEWVDGERLDLWCATQRPDLRQRLQLLIAVCRGVQHAHSRNIVHRDLKPANILVQRVDGLPTPKIIDFGIAIAAGTTQTRAIGTPDYMSPEQRLEGEVSDQRTDVYALGVILFQLLAEHFQCDTVDFFATDPAERADWLARAMVSRCAIPEEYLAVVQKAIQPGREQRYASVDALAADLQALSTQQPVSALPHTPRYVVRKFVQRNRAAVLASGLALAGLLGALFLAALGWWQADLQNQTTERTARFLSSILIGVRPEHAQGKDLSLMRQVLDDATARLPLELADAPAVQADIAATISDTYNTLGDAQRAIEVAAAALSQAQAELGEEHHASLTLAARLARYRVVRGESAVVAELEAILQTQQRLFGEADAESIASAAYLSNALRSSGQIERARRLGEDLLARVPVDVENAAPFESLMSETAIALGMSGDSEGALELQRRVIRSREARQGATAFDVVASRAEYGSTLFVSKRYAEALETFRSVLPEYIRIFGAEHPQTLSIRGNVAAAQSLTGDAKGALPLAEELLEARMRVHGRDHPETLLALGNVAATALRAGDMVRAESAFREFIVLCDALRQSSHPSCAERRAGLGKVLRQRGAYVEAERWLLESYKLKQQAEGKHFSGPEQVAAELVLLYQAWGKTAEAARWQQAAAKVPEP